MHFALKWPGHPALLVFLLVWAGLGSGGCVTAGLAALGPVVGSISALGDRSVERTIPADLSTTWGATVDALARMAVRVEQTEKSGNRWQLTGVDGSVTVYGTLERVTASMTKVSVRVEAGSIFADKRTGEELLNQVGASLASLTGSGPHDAAAAVEASAARFGALQRAIERLGTKVEEARDGRDARRLGGSPEISTPSPTVTTSPIITVPASAGVATVPGAVPALVQQRSAPAFRREEREAQSVPSEAQSVPSEAQSVPSMGPRERRKDPTGDIMASPLSSVEVLRPVEGLTIRPAGQ
jgi:hypothetical protein